MNSILNKGESMLRIFIGLGLVAGHFVSAAANDGCGCTRVHPSYLGSFTMKVHTTIFDAGETDFSDSQSVSNDWDWYEIRGTSSGTVSTADVSLGVNDHLWGADTWTKGTRAAGAVTYSWEWESSEGWPAPGGVLNGHIIGAGTLSGGGSAPNPTSSASSAGAASSTSSVSACGVRDLTGASLSADGSVVGGQPGTVSVDAGADVEVSGEAGESVETGPGKAPNSLSVVNGEVTAGAHYTVTETTSNQSNGNYSFSFAWTQNNAVAEEFSSAAVSVSVATAATASATATADGGYSIASVFAQAACSFSGNASKCVEIGTSVDDGGGADTVGGGSGGGVTGALNP